MDDKRLKAMEDSWIGQTPPAHIAMEQMKELVAEVRGLRRKAQAYVEMEDRVLRYEAENLRLKAENLRLKAALDNYDPGEDPDTHICDSSCG